MVAHGLESRWGERLKEWKPDPKHDARITTRVPCADYFGVRDQALMAHATQIDPDGPFFHIPLDIQRAVWPTEDFELVESHVETILPEDDLFAGIGAHRPRSPERHLRRWGHEPRTSSSPSSCRWSTGCPRTTT